MSDSQLLRLREEYHKANRHKLEIEASIRDLEDRLELIRKLQDSLQNGEFPSKDLLNALNVKARSNLTLMYKVKGLKKETEDSLIEQRTDAQKVRTILASLDVCPRCSGLGTLSGQTRYERMQEGAIIPIPSSSKCHMCNGSGKLVLDR